MAGQVAVSRGEQRAIFSRIPTWSIDAIDYRRSYSYAVHLYGGTCKLDGKIASNRLRGTFAGLAMNTSSPHTLALHCVKWQLLIMRNTSFTLITILAGTRWHIFQNFKITTSQQLIVKSNCTNVIGTTFFYVFTPTMSYKLHRNFSSVNNRNKNML